MHDPQLRRLLLATFLVFAVSASACAHDDGTGVPATGSVTGGPDDPDDPPGGKSNGEADATGIPAPGASGDIGPRGADATGAATDDATASASPDAPPTVPSNLPRSCPPEVVGTGAGLTGGFEHAEIPPTDGFAILTCGWRDPGGSIASIEVSFSAELFGSSLADVDGAEQVNVAGVDGYLIHTEDRKVTADMFQFYTGGIYITGGSLEVEDVDQGDVLELAAAAIEAVRGG